MLLRRLALAGPQGLPREELVMQLWGGSDDASIGHRFNTMMTEVRHLLRVRSDGPTPILNGDGHYRFNQAAGVVVDIHRFDTLVDQGHAALAGGDAASALLAYERALDLYTGDLYLGRGLWNELEALIEQERLRSRCLTVLAHAALLAGRAGNHECAMGNARRLLTMDPCSEIGHRLVMQLYALRHLRGQSLRQYRVCTEAMRREYDAGLEPASLALYELIRRGEWTAEAGWQLIES
jgi:DNA-binding SARP family transcriptional activator